MFTGKQAYLNAPFFFIRAAVYIFGWWYASKRLIALSRKEDTEGGLSSHKRSITISAIFIGFFGYTSSMMAWDWIMSIDTHWFSTLFGWFVFSSMGVTGFTTIAMVVKPVTPILEKTNHPNNVLNQWVSIDIIQSQAIIEDV